MAAMSGPAHGRGVLLHHLGQGIDPGQKTKPIQIREALGWSPKVGIEEGVAIMLDNIEYWRDAPVWTPGKIAAAIEDWFKFLGK